MSSSICVDLRQLPCWQFPQRVTPPPTSRYVSADADALHQHPSRDTSPTSRPSYARAADCRIRPFFPHLASLIPSLLRRGTDRPPAMSYFFATPVDIDVVLEDTDDRAMVDVKLDKNRREKAPLYMDGESVKGAVTVRPKDGKRLEHTGIKVQFVGIIGRCCIAPFGP